MQYIQKAKMVSISHCVELEISNVLMNILSTLDMNSAKMGPIYSLIQTIHYGYHQGRTMLQIAPLRALPSIWWFTCTQTVNKKLWSRIHHPVKSPFGCLKLLELKSLFPDFIAYPWWTFRIKNLDHKMLPVIQPKHWNLDNTVTSVMLLKKH